MSLHAMVMTVTADEAEHHLRKAPVTILRFYLLGENRGNFITFNYAAAKLLTDKRIRGNRRDVLEKFTGRIAALRLSCKLQMEGPCPD